MSDVREILQLVKDGGAIALVALLFAGWKWVVYPYLQERDARFIEVFKRFGANVERRFDSIEEKLGDMKSDMHSIGNDVHRGAVTRTRMATIPPIYHEAQ